MDKDLARHMAHIALASASRLTIAAVAVGKHCSSDEIATYTQAIANVTACVEREILDKVYTAYPELRGEIQTRIAKFGPRI
jgi:hypothetical protein